MASYISNTFLSISNYGNINLYTTYTFRKHYLMNSCPSSSSSETHVEIHLYHPLPVPFDDIYIRVEIEYPHKILYYVRVIGCPVRQVTKEFFEEVIDTI